MARNTAIQAYNDVKRTSLRLPVALVKRAKKIAVDANTNLQTLVTDGLELVVGKLEAKLAAGREGVSHE
jgi:hypothetical protein